MERHTYVYAGGFEMPDKNAAAHRVTNIGRIMRDNGYRVVYVGISREIGFDTDVFSTREEYNGFECYAVGYPKSLWEWVRYESGTDQYTSIIKSLAHIDGVIFYNFPALSMKNLVRYCRKRKIKCYADVTEWNYFGWGGLIWGLIKSVDTWYRMHFIHKKLDGMIVISRYLNWYYRDLSGVVRIPVLADIKDPKWKNPYEKSMDVLYLVYAGQARKKDRLDHLIDALMNVERPYHLDVIGLAKDEYEEMFPGHRQWLADNGRILFHGRISHDETLEYIKRANYSCFFRSDNLISRAGFPTKFVEAICCGTPVITNRTSDLAYYMRNGKNGILLEDFEMFNLARVIEECNYTCQVESQYFDYRKYSGKLLNMLYGSEDQ